MQMAISTDECVSACVFLRSGASSSSERIEAKDLKEAIRLAGQIPAARLGCVEGRPFR
jgi:hypothetical protein